MQLSNIRIKNYRTISNEQTLDLGRSVTLVGPNNAGKTNVLTAIRMLFTGHENKYDYEKSQDLTFGERSGQTSIIGSFRGVGTAADEEIYTLYQEIKNHLGVASGTPSTEPEEIQLYLTFSNSSNPSYRFFPNTRRPTENTQKAAYSRKERELTAKILDQFICHYVPSNKSFEQIYNDLLIPFIRSHVAGVLHDKTSEIRQQLEQAANSITEALKASGLENIQAKFDIPEQKITSLLTGFDFNLLDPNETSIFKKGVGIQSAAILSSFEWIAQQERSSGLETIWLIEEPESFLHPQLNESCKKLLKRLSQNSLTVITTHSLSFVPQDPKSIAGVNITNSKTALSTFRTYKEATESIRKSIGVKFSDFFNFGKYNILLEGQTDREYLQWIIERIPDSTLGCEWPDLRSSECNMLDYGGVKFLSGFIRSCWDYICKETIAVAIFDGDAAGEKERKELQGFFGNKGVQFNPNQDYISVKKGSAIEALFPDSWVISCHNDHSGWFDDFSVDAAGSLESFSLKDGSKNSFSRYMREKSESEADLNWAGNWIQLCTTIENAIGFQKRRISLD